MNRFWNKYKIIIVFACVFLTRVSTATNPAVFVCSSFIDTSYIEITKVNCDVGAEICLNIPLGDFMTYTLTDNGQPYSGGVNACDFDTSFAYTYFMIPGAGTAGPYMIDLWSVDGNNYSGQVADMAELTDSMNVWDPFGNWVLDSPTSSIRGGITSISYGNMEVTQISSGNAATINPTTSLNPKGSLIYLETGTHELIFTEPTEGCLDTIMVVINCTPCPVIYTGNTSYMAEDCFSNTAVCFEIPMPEIPEYTITDNGLPFTGTIQECALESSFSYDYSGVPSQGTSGPYQLQNWMVNGSVFIGVFGTITELVNAMNIWDPGGNWVLNVSALTITGGNGANVYSNIQILQIMSGLSGTAVISTIPSQSSIELSLPTGNHELVFANSQTLCQDTVSIFIDCVPCPDFFGGIPIAAEALHCDSIVGICLPIPYSEIGDYDFIINGTPYTGSFQSCQMDSSLILLDTGIYHIVVTHSITACKDSVDVTINCVPEGGCSGFLSDETRYLNINDCNDLAAFCVEIPFSEINEYSIFDNNVLYENSIEPCNSDTVNASISLTSGVHQLIFRHDITSCRDTVDVLVACISTAYLNMTILVNAIDTICMDTTQLMSEVVSFENICETSSGEYVLFELDTDNYCVIYTGIEEGIENACIVVCDDLGYCDTTFIAVSVEQIMNSLPDAMDDFGSTAMNSPLTLDILANDAINGTIDTIYLQTLPENGSVVLNNDGTLIYTPDTDFCNSTLPDEFLYVLCNENGCDSAMISMTVTCEALKVYNGFSPNGDGKNDSFVIKGALDLPGNRLFVYNRWGLLVYQADNYQNDWRGTWEGAELADGTYFYVFDDGKGNVLSGYVQIYR